MAAQFVPPEMVRAKAYSKLPPRIRIEAAIETLIEILEAADPDADFEEIGAQDSFQPHDDDRPGSSVADPGGCEHNGCEPENDAESETWSHPDDHPAELVQGRRQ